MKPDTNRTGALTNMNLTADLMRGVERLSPQPDLDQTDVYQMRAIYTKQAAPIGSLPETADGKMAVLLDKIGARLAFEREGTRLYQMLMQKHAAASSQIPKYSDLERIGNQEWDHFVLLQDTILELGGDPTIVTPAADVAHVITAGVHKVIADPRTTMSQCFDAILTAELVDNASWEMLVNAARTLQRDNLGHRFENALREEQEHLTNVRSWLQLDLQQTLAA